MLLIGNSNSKYFIIYVYCIFRLLIIPEFRNHPELPSSYCADGAYWLVFLFANENKE